VISLEGRTRSAENYLRMVLFRRPEWTPCAVNIMPATWMARREELEEIVLSHPRLFPGYRKGEKDFDATDNPLYEPGLHRDRWGSVWRNIERGLDSVVVEHPLESWESFEGWGAPGPGEDLFGPRPDPEEVRRELERAKAGGEVAQLGPLPHGFFFQRLYYLRGFENLMMDMATGDGRLRRLISAVEGYNRAVIERYAALGPELMGFGDDLGMQTSLPVSPQMWREWLKASYVRMFEPCRERGVLVYFHSDGHILEIIPDLIEAGVTVINPQVRANGLDGLREVARGRVAIFLDLDRQLFPFASPGRIEEHVGRAHEALSLPEGGLGLSAEIEPDVPLENVEAVCRALERVCRPPEPETLSRRG